MTTFDAHTSSPNNSEVKYTIARVDPDKFSTYKISAIKHNYHTHPLLQIPRLQQLAEYLMERKLCRFVNPDISIDSRFTHHTEDTEGKSLSEVFNNLENPRSWIALYNIEKNPEYKAFLEEMMAKVVAFVEPEQMQLLEVGGFIFISAPPSVTPYHIDRENNFWLQVKGQKQLSLFDPQDKEILDPKVVEEFIVHRSLENVRLDSQISSKAQNFTMQEGDGMYFPSTTPHMTRTTTDWVGGDNRISISIGVVFYSRHTQRMARIHQCNLFLRKLGFHPEPPETSGWSSPLKSSLGFCIARLKKVFRGYQPPPWSC